MADDLELALVNIGDSIKHLIPVNIFKDQGSRLFLIRVVVAFMQQFLNNCC